MTGHCMLFSLKKIFKLKHSIANQTDYEDIETLGVSASVRNSVGDSKKSTTITAIDLDINIAYRPPESMSAAENVACVDQVSTVVDENTRQAECDHLSSLKSRVPRLVQKSAEGFENPVTTATIQYETFAQGVIASAENVVCDASQLNTIEDNDFSSLRSRRAAQMRNSAEDPVIIASNAHEGMTCHTENAPHTCEDTSQLKTLEDENQTDYDSFSSLRARLVTQSRSSCGNPVMAEGTEEHTDHDERVITKDFDRASS